MDQQSNNRLSTAKIILLREFIKRIQRFTLIGTYLYVRLRLRGKTITVAGSCHGCGSCCRSFSIEGESGWLRSEQSFFEIAKNDADYQRLSLLSKNVDGVLLFQCSWLSPQGKCRNYDQRLTICRKFPESSLYFAGGELPKKCGYKFVEVAIFAKILQREIRQKK